MFKTSEECRLELVAYTRMAEFVDDTPIPGDTISKRWFQPAMDFMPCSAARVSFGNEDKTGNDVEKDKKLMNYLADHQHMTPFEYQHATFLIEVPLFIRSQIMRHRSFSFNEISRRYTDENIEFWRPNTWRGQSKSNRQASEGELAWPVILYGIDGKNGVGNPFEDSIDIAVENYKWLIANGYSREQARAVLPQSLLTKFYMGGNLRSFQHFIKLRRDEHAQIEVQIVANRIAAKLRELWPNSCEALGI